MNIKAVLNTKKVLALVLAGVSAAAIFGAAATPVSAADYTQAVAPKTGETEVLYRAGSSEGDEETNWMVTYPKSISLDDNYKNLETGRDVEVTLKPLDAGKTMKIESLTVTGSKDGIVTLSGTTSGSELKTVEATVAPNTTNGNTNVLTVDTTDRTKEVSGKPLKVWVTEDNQKLAWNKVQYKGNMELNFQAKMPTTTV